MYSRTSKLSNSNRMGLRHVYKSATWKKKSLTGTKYSKTEFINGVRGKSNGKIVMPIGSQQAIKIQVNMHAFCISRTRR